MDLKNKVFIDAVFTSPQRDTVEALWGNPDNDEIYQEYIQVDPDSLSYQDLLKEAKIDFDDIIEATAERNRQQRRDFELSTIKIGQEEGWIPKVQVVEEENLPDGSVKQEISIKTEHEIKEEVYGLMAQKMFSNTVPESREMKEFMFMTKLFLFDHEKIKEHSDTKRKAELRRSKTPLEMLKAAAYLLD
tara:strand:+ start:2779 stop:3345 length:567 start_codon:yes stop_codon:yes gene_type:complete